MRRRIATAFALGFAASFVGGALARAEGVASLASGPDGFDAERGRVLDRALGQLARDPTVALGTESVRETLRQGGALRGHEADDFFVRIPSVAEDPVKLPAPRVPGLNILPVGPEPLDPIPTPQLPNGTPNRPPAGLDPISAAAWVLTRERPMLAIDGGGIPEKERIGDAALLRLVTRHEDALVSLSRRVTRLRVGGVGASGFLLDGRRVLTNHHVAEIACGPTPENAVANDASSTWWVRDQVAAGAGRFVVDRPVEISVERCLEVDAVLDVAILQLASPAPVGPGLRGRIRRAALDLRDDHPIAVIGFPTFRAAQFLRPEEWERRIAAERFVALYGGRLDDQRVSPGLLRARLRDGKTHGHDATTYDGSSGSLVVSLETLEVIGIHHTGAPEPEVRQRLGVYRINLLSLFHAAVGRPIDRALATVETSGSLVATRHEPAR